MHFIVRPLSHRPLKSLPQHRALDRSIDCALVSRLAISFQYHLDGDIVAGHPAGVVGGAGR
jgi:hypothetical protein